MTNIVCFHQMENGNIIIHGLYSNTAYPSLFNRLEKYYGKLTLIGVTEYHQSLADWHMKLDLRKYRVYSVASGRRTPTGQFYSTPEVMEYIEQRLQDIPVSSQRPCDPGVVYFAKSSKGLKIGFSTKFEDRQKALRYKYPDIEFIGFMAGTMRTENELHRRFRKHMITDAKSGCPNIDWFYPCKSIDNYIRLNCQPDWEPIVATKNAV